MSKQRKPLTDEQKARQREANRRWLAKPGNREKALAASRAWREKNKDRISARSKAEWADPEKRAKRQALFRSWSERNHEAQVAKAIDTMHRRRVISPELAGTFTLEEWNAMLDKYDHRCGYCGKGGVRLDRDHIVPLSRGGRHDASNIIPACRSCNVRKGTKLLDEWLAA